VLDPGRDFDNHGGCSRIVSKAETEWAALARSESPSPEGHEHYWVDARDDETGWHCTICGTTEYPGGEFDPEDAVESPSPEGLTEALRSWLRHKDWCNVKTDDPPDTERCKCGLRAALVG
jgi:hypothetical protein